MLVLFLPIYAVNRESCLPLANPRTTRQLMLQNKGFQRYLMMKIPAVHIQFLCDTKLVGQKMKMTFACNKTSSLWQNFMPGRHAIQNQLGTELYSVEVYGDLTFYEDFDTDRTFEKWAAVRVDRFGKIPGGMEGLEIPAGLYAVFHYVGKASDAAEIYGFIFNHWIPNSEYTLDNRPHLAVMGEKYKNEHPLSEEEIWVPVMER